MSRPRFKSGFRERVRRWRKMERQHVGRHDWATARAQHPQAEAPAWLCNQGRGWTIRRFTRDDLWVHARGCIHPIFRMPAFRDNPSALCGRVEHSRAMGFECFCGEPPWPALASLPVQRKLRRSA